MKLLLKISYILLLAVVSKADIKETFIEHEVVPDVISSAPGYKVTLLYPSGAVVDEGNELIVSQLQEVPEATWEADADKFYTLCMVDPDAPSRQNRTLAEVQHWVVVNIPGNDVDAGEVLSAYFGPAPPQGVGLHRYVFLVYQQPSEQNFDERRLTETDITVEDRTEFSIANFAHKYALGDPVAGNLFLAQHEE